MKDLFSLALFFSFAVLISACSKEEKTSEANPDCANNKTGIVCFINGRADTLGFCIGCNFAEIFIPPGDTFCQIQDINSVVTYYSGSVGTSLNPIAAYQVDECEEIYEEL